LRLLAKNYEFIENNSGVSMKNYKRVFFVFNVFQCLCLNSFAHSATIDEHCDVECSINPRQLVENKFYIQPGTIYFSPTQILLNLSGNLFPIKHLFCDEMGVFVLVEEIYDLKAQNDYWECRHCGTLNEGRRYCSLCLKPRK
jgi:hypothetical protein